MMTEKSAPPARQSSYGKAKKRTAAQIATEVKKKVAEQRARETKPAALEALEAAPRPDDDLKALDPRAFGEARLARRAALRYMWRWGGNMVIKEKLYRKLAQLGQ